jgi:uncharacterized RDD family membrane protein YckC
VDFLPIKKDGLKVYAGFWKRLGASLVDGLALSLVLFPIQFILIWHVSKPTWGPIADTVISNISFPAYTIFFHYRYGATLGKMVTDIKVTLPDGSPIGFKEAFLRSYVDLGFSIVAMFSELSAIGNTDAEQIQWSGWAGTVAIIGLIWFWSEVVVLLFNERKRSIHDFIAGTVVVHKRFAR